MGISYAVVVLPSFVQEKCPKDDLGVTLKVALGDLLRGPVGGKEGRKGVRTGSMKQGEEQSVLRE